MSGTIINFPVKSGSAGSVFCKPLNIYFPQLYRDTNILTAADLAEWNVDDAQPGTTIYYTLDREEHYIGEVHRERARCIREPGALSLTIRYHPTMEEASAYLLGVNDYVADETVTDPICRTDSGFFTLIHRATSAAWPSPLVIYSAFHPAPNQFGIDHWSLAIASDGSTMEQFEV